MYQQEHTVQYYETDRMGITHHSNYVRWMEEARVGFLKDIGWDYAKLESSGIISPVTEVECNYKKSTTFEELVVIQVSVAEFKGVRLKLNYKMFNDQDELVCQASSEHCFLNGDGKLVCLKKDYPDFYQAIMEQLDEN